MDNDVGRSGSADRATHEPSPDGLGHSVGIANAWQPIETAPKDGAWLLLEGEMSGGGTSSVRIGRFAPVTDKWGTYEWQCLDDSYGGGACGDHWDTAVPNWNWYPEGRVAHWMPLPEPPQ